MRDEMCSNPDFQHFALHSGSSWPVSPEILWTNASDVYPYQIFAHCSFDKKLHLDSHEQSAQTVPETAASQILTQCCLGNR